ncbi:flagellar biosynthesis protein FlgI [Saccharospirillum sp. MSK14-1]|uniref:flagellar basal body P-ring protein FlgI n=1 Tax=Saccharospirillum sp. MSK14-1 TaxID=1897632 RepID=UPI000D33EF5E|nr:flagellar basal body P-ring protein FlgI [Saccharospirillum sp. MSK14-1]PTY36785.1 flagellar biosynthesis protein FlgI [Saccharospirillum sp. MSK14-1]
MKQLLIVLIAALTMPVWADRIKDLSSVQGVRNNQLVGYGLVVGLDGSGDRAPFTNQTFRNMMEQFGITIPEGENPNLNNVAAVSVHATLPPFSKPGQEIDVTVSSIGNADSLRGGSLLLTPLRGPDGQTYAVAQGNLVVSGFGAEGEDGSSISVNVQNAGRIPNGAIVERGVANTFSQGDYMTFNLHRPDFTTAKRMSGVINELLGPGAAYAVDAASVRVTAPRDPNQRVNFISVLENLDVQPGEEAARVIINSRTGTIVVGQHVTVSPVAITHGNMTVTIDNTQNVDQPPPFSEGETAVVPDTEIEIDEGDNRMFLFGPTVTLSDIVDAVNEVGAAPGDLMAILEALKSAGALKAELIVI